MATINNNGGVLTSAAFSPTQSQYTLNTAPGTNSTWATTATYNGFTGCCSSEPIGAKYYRITPDARVRVSQYGKKVIWISECKFLINLDNKGNYSVNVVVDDWNNLEFNTIDEARRHLLRLSKTYKEMVAFTKKLDINTMFEDSNENKV
jgi:hypothetical protein